MHQYIKYKASNLANTMYIENTIRLNIRNENYYLRRKFYSATWTFHTVVSFF